MKNFDVIKMGLKTFFAIVFLSSPFLGISQCPASMGSTGVSATFTVPDQATVDARPASIVVNGITSMALAGTTSDPFTYSYLIFGTSLPATVDFGGAIGVCAYTATGNFVPTLSQWGLITLALLLMTFGTLYATAPAVQLVNGQTIPGKIDFRNLPFEKDSFFKLWAGIATIAAIGFTAAVVMTNYEMTFADPFGSIIASGVLAYLVMLVGKIEK